MTTNRVTKGDSLNSLVLQPGWTIEDDGYGLISTRATFTQSHGNAAGTTGGTGPYALSAAPKRGDIFGKDGRLACNRSSSSLNSNGLLVVTAEYVGIAQGNMTSPQISGRGATSTERIATHPVFTSVIGGKKGSEKNGAIFNDDESFKAFVNPENRKYGVTSYLAPTFSINGHFYTSDITIAKKLLDAQCTVSSDGKFPHGGGIQLVGKFNAFASQSAWSIVGGWVAPDESPQLLLTGVAIEDYGRLLKVSFDITVSTDGWDYQIYPYGSRPARDNTISG